MTFKMHGRWTRGAAHRRMEYVQSQTESIRVRTVKGLEPELERLVETHRCDIEERHAGRDASEEIMLSELAANFLRKRARIREVAHGNKTGEIGDKIRGRELELKREAQQQYTSAIKGRSFLTSRVRTGFQEQWHQDTARCQRERGEMQAKADQYFAAARKQLQKQFGLVQELLICAQNAVTSVRLSDQTSWMKVTSAQFHVAVATAVAITTADLARRRDFIIDTTIRQVQVPTLVWEAGKVFAADKRKASLKLTHLVAASALRTQRAEWVDMHVITLHENQFLYEQLGKLRTAEVAAKKKRNVAKEYVAKPRNYAKVHASNIKDSHLKRRLKQVTVITSFKNMCAAAATASHAIATELQCIDNAHNCAQMQFGKSHQNALKIRDDEVKLKFHASAKNMVQIKCTLELERVRHTHLGKILVNYECYNHNN